MVCGVSVPEGWRPPQADLQSAWTVPTPVAIVVEVAGTVVVVVDVVVVGAVVGVEVVVAGADVVVVAGGAVVVVAGCVEVVVPGGGSVVEVVRATVWAVVVESGGDVVEVAEAGRDPPAWMVASDARLACQAQVAVEPTPTRPASAARNCRRERGGTLIGQPG
jgi:hypothetical protein